MIKNDFQELKNMADQMTRNVKVLTNLSKSKLHEMDPEGAKKAIAIASNVEKALKEMKEGNTEKLQQILKENANSSK